MSSKLERGEFVIRNSNGFTLLEVMLSLLILSMATLFVIPIIIGISQERVAIKQHEQALLVLEKQVLEYLHDSNQEVVFDSLYTSDMQLLEDGTMKFCLSWKGANQRDQTSCLFAK